MVTKPALLPLNLLPLLMLLLLMLTVIESATMMTV
jgi:hypothetical protein